MTANLPPHSRAARALAKLPDADKEAIGRYIQEQADERVRAGFLRVLEYGMMVSLLVLIRVFGFGTVKRGRGVGRIERFVGAFQRVAGEYTDTYDEAAYEAMRMHLREAGVEMKVEKI